MDFKKCEALLAAIDTGSFTKAAEQLHYTPSGISDMMTNLEAELGFPLLYRSKTGVVPTPSAFTPALPPAGCLPSSKLLPHPIPASASY